MYGSSANAKVFGLKGDVAGASRLLAMAGMDSDSDSDEDMSSTPAEGSIGGTHNLQSNSGDGRRLHRGINSERTPDLAKDSLNIDRREQNKLNSQRSSDHPSVYQSQTTHGHSQHSYTHQKVNLDEPNRVSRSSSSTRNSKSSFQQPKPPSKPNDATHSYNMSSQAAPNTMSARPMNGATVPHKPSAPPPKVSLHSPKFVPTPPRMYSDSSNLTSQSHSMNSQSTSLHNAIPNGYSQSFTTSSRLSSTSSTPSYSARPPSTPPRPRPPVSARNSDGGANSHTQKSLLTRVQDPSGRLNPKTPVLSNSNNVDSSTSSRVLPTPPRAPPPPPPPKSNIPRSINFEPDNDAHESNQTTTQNTVPVSSFISDTPEQPSRLSDTSPGSPFSDLSVSTEFIGVGKVSSPGSERPLEYETVEPTSIDAGNPPQLQADASTKLSDQGKTNHIAMSHDNLTETVQYQSSHSHALDTSSQGSTAPSTMNDRLRRLRAVRQSRPSSMTTPRQDSQAQASSPHDLDNELDVSDQTDSLARPKSRFFPVIRLQKSKNRLSTARVPLRDPSHTEISTLGSSSVAKNEQKDESIHQSLVSSTSMNKTSSQTVASPTSTTNNFPRRKWRPLSLRSPQHGVDMSNKTSPYSKTISPLSAYSHPDEANFQPPKNIKEYSASQGTKSALGKTAMPVPGHVLGARRVPRAKSSASIFSSTDYFADFGNESIYSMDNSVDDGMSVNSSVLDAELDRVLARRARRENRKRNTSNSSVRLLTYAQSKDIPYSDVNTDSSFRSSHSITNQTFPNSSTDEPDQQKQIHHADQIDTSHQNSIVQYNPSPAEQLFRQVTRWKVLNKTSMHAEIEARLRRQQQLKLELKPDSAQSTSLYTIDANPPQSNAVLDFSHISDVPTQPVTTQTALKITGPGAEKMKASLTGIQMPSLKWIQESLENIPVCITNIEVELPDMPPSSYTSQEDSFIDQVFPHTCPSFSFFQLLLHDPYINKNQSSRHVSFAQNSNITPNETLDATSRGETNGPINLCIQLQTPSIEAKSLFDKKVQHDAVSSMAKDVHQSHEHEGLLPCIQTTSTGYLFRHVKILSVGLGRSKQWAWRETENILHGAMTPAEGSLYETLGSALLDGAIHLRFDAQTSVSNDLPRNVRITLDICTPTETYAKATVRGLLVLHALLAQSNSM